MERWKNVQRVPGTVFLYEVCHILTSVQSNNDEADTASFSQEASGMKEMVDIAALNSRVKFDKLDVPFAERQILGDATETGLARFAGRQLNDYDEHHKKHPKVFEVPFNSTNKWALTIVSDLHYPPQSDLNMLQ